MQNQNDSIEYPIRINRYLYLNNFCSRRKADELIEQGLVKINGKTAVLGQKISETDKVELNNSIKRMAENYEYFMFNKPKGVVSHTPQNGEKTVEDFVPQDKRGKKLSPVGRLDKDSTGFLLMTNDGRIIDKMLNPKYDHEKEYLVRVDKSIKESFINKLQKGVNIEGYVTKESKVKATGDKSFSIVLTEGKKHQIRRMVAALGSQVRELKRIRIMGIRMSKVEVGEVRPLTQEEKFKLLKEIKVI